MVPDHLPQLSAGYHGVPKGHLAAVVTVLEMKAMKTAPPASRDGVILQHVQNPDTGWYRGLFKRVGAPWLWASRLSWDDQTLSDRIHAPRTQIYAVKTKTGEDIGFFELDFFEQEKCEIAFLGIAQEQIGRGIGGWLMQHALSHAFQGGAKTVSIHTCTLDEARALALYRKYGFKPVRRAVEILADPRQSGLLPLDVSDQPLL